MALDAKKVIIGAYWGLIPDPDRWLRGSNKMWSIKIWTSNEQVRDGRKLEFKTALTVNKYPPLLVWLKAGSHLSVKMQ